MKPVFAFLRALGLLLACWLPTAAHADDFQEGITAFKAGQYRQAETFFARAERAGSRKITLQYNLAVVYFRLRDYENAKKRFGTLATVAQWRELAQYNLGLIALEQQKQQQAQELFTQVSANSSNPKLRILADNQLHQLQAAQRRQQELSVVDATAGSLPTVVALLKLGVNSDDNVANLPAKLAGDANNKDTAWDMLGYVHGYLYGLPDDGLRLYGFVYSHNYQRTHFFDTELYSAGLAQEFKLWGLNASGGTQIIANRTDNFHSSNKYGATITISKRLPRTTLTTELHANYEDAKAGYQHTQGNQQRITLGFMRLLGNFELKIDASHEQSARDDLRSGEFFYSYSPTINSLNTQFNWLATTSLKLESNIIYSNSRYDDKNHLRDIDGIIKQKPRVADQWQAAVAIAWQITVHWKIKADYRYIDWKDNFLIYTYDKQMAGVSTEYVYW